ncbi:MAG: alkane 1-monooxygenase [Flavicella sp.]
MKKHLKHYLILLVPIICAFSMKVNGVLTFTALFTFTIAVPLLELFTTPYLIGFDRKKALKEKRKFSYNILLILGCSTHYLLLFYFFNNISETTFLSIEYFGKISSMGLCCGILGINIGHEMGHRNHKFYQLLGEMSLLTSLYCHYLPYHNEVHHYLFATDKDPGTARKNESVYTFWLRTQLSYIKLSIASEINQMKRLEKAKFSLSNRMVIYTIYYLLALSFIWIKFGYSTLIAFVISAVFGILFTETFNYVSHYGLQRETVNNIPERATVKHSWNANYPISLLLLLSRPRHSDHHKNSSKSYHLLLSLENSRTLPTGFLGMMMCALIPPLWRRIMHKRL